MSKSATPTCHYCPRIAVQNVVWLKDKEGQAARILLPHCGCNLMAALRRFWPNPYPIKFGTDYVFERFTDPPVRAEGDGRTVTLYFRRGSDVVIAEGNDVVYVRMPKRLVRELAEEARRAADVAEPGCTDPDAHFHGHCGCK